MKGLLYIMKMTAENGPWLNLSDGMCVLVTVCDVCSLTSRAEIEYKLVSLISEFRRSNNKTIFLYIFLL